MGEMKENKPKQKWSHVNRVGGSICSLVKFMQIRIVTVKFGLNSASQKIQCC